MFEKQEVQCQECGASRNLRGNRRQKMLVLLVGAVCGSLLTGIFAVFPGGRGEVLELQLSFKDGGEYTVKRVVDGDTIIIEPGIYVRYAGVNTPETKKVINVTTPFGKEADQANRQLVEGKKVRLRFGREMLDCYGRLLACVEVKDSQSGQWLDVGARLIRSGLARPFFKGEGPPNRDELSRALAEARDARRGIWGLPSQRWKARKRTSGATAK